jgi:uracil phosphoribosyltransferase
VRTLVVDHPLVAHKLTALRDAKTDSPTFRRLADELVTLLAYEATRDVRVEPVEVETPVATATGCRLSRPVPLVVPVLRAGLGMLDGMTRLLPTAEVGFLGMVATRRACWRRRTRTGCPTTCPAARSSSSTRCSRPAARS